MALKDDIISFAQNKVRNLASNLGYQARNAIYSAGESAWSPQGVLGKSVNAIQSGINTVSNLGRIELPKATPQQIPSGVVRTGVNLAVGLPESIINIPRNYVVGISRTGQELGTAIKQQRPLNYQNLAAGIAPLGESLLDVGTLGGAGVAKNIAKEGLKSTAKQAIVKGALTGAGYGSLGGLTYGLDTQYGKKFDFGNVAQSTVGGAVLGGVLGGATGGIGSLLGSVQNKIKAKVSELMPNATPMEIQAATDRFTRDEMGKFTGLKVKTKEPVFYGDLRESIGLPRNGDYSGGYINFGEMKPTLTKKLSPETPKGKIPIKGLATSEQVPVIKRPAQVDLQTQQVVKPNQLDSASEQIIQEGRNQIGKFVEPKKTLSQKFDELYTNWVDRYNPLVKLTEKVKGIAPEQDPKYVIRRFLGAGSIAEQRFNQEMKPILSEVDKLKIDKLDLDTYLVNKRNLGFGDIGREVKGSDPVKAKNIVTALEAKYGPNISGIADKLYAFQDKGLEDMVKAGFITPESANAMRGQNPNYAPFQRLMDEANDYIGLPTKKAMQGSQPIQKLKGSERKILSPVESIIANIFSQRAAIEKNNVAKSVVGLKDIIPQTGFKKLGKEAYNTIKVGEEYVRRPKPLSQLPDSAIIVFNNGKREVWDVGSDIGRAMKGMNEESASSFMKILTAPASLLRQGATGQNPEFMLPNVIRDQLDAAVNSKYGYIPFVDYIKGLAHIVKKDDVYNQWMESGGAQSFGSITGRKSISEMFDQTKARKTLASWVFGKIGGALDVMGKYSEQPTRVGLFANALKKTGSPLLSAYESREGTMDFARMGAKMKVANSIIPFLNVGVQGFDKMIRNFKDAPVPTTLKMGIYGVTPAVMAALYNNKFHPAEYAEIPQFVKDDNFILVKGRNDKGTVDYVAIPKGNLIKLVTNPAEHFVNYLAQNEPTSFGEMVSQLLSSTLPVLGEGSSPKEIAIKTIGQNIPQAIKPITENLLNKSFYKYDAKKEQSKEIVPTYLQKKPAGEQAYKFTPAIYQGIGRVLNVSPLQVQNLMEGYLAGFTKIPANIVDSLVNLSENKPVEQNKIPILRRFIQETYPTKETEAKAKPQAASIIQTVQAADGKTYQTGGLTGDQYLTYKNQNGNDAKLSLTKLEAIGNLPTTNKYQTAIKESKQYQQAATILDNPGLDAQQKQQALQALGVDPVKAAYYQVANDNTNKKTMYMLDAINQIATQGGTTQDAIKILMENRQQVNGQMIASNVVLDNLVDEGVISANQAKEIKKYKLENGKAVKMGKTSVKKLKKISVKMPRLNKVKVKKIKLKKLKVKKFKQVKLKAPKRLKLSKLKL